MHLFAYTSQKTLDNGNPVSLLDAPVTDDSGKLKLYDIVYDAGESALTLHFDYFRAPDTAYAECVSRTERFSEVTRSRAAFTTASAAPMCSYPTRFGGGDHRRHHRKPAGGNH